MPDASGDSASAQLRRAALRRQGTPNGGLSPLALEATLAQISAEVTQEAGERKQDQGK